MSPRTPHPAAAVAAHDEDAAALRTGAGILLSLLALGGAVLAYSLGVEPYALRLTRPRLSCRRLPAELDGLRVLFLTDAHVSEWGRRERKLLEMLAALPERPELIVWGGDFLHHGGDIPVALRLCERVRRLFPADVPVVTVLGNSEHKISARRRAAFVARLEATGMAVLNNRQLPMVLRPGAPAITVAGVDDPYYGHDRLGDALSPCPPSERFTLLLAHSPQIAVRAAKAGVDVMLSGHTHGGQVRLPLIGPLKTQNPLGRGMAAGAFDRRKTAAAIGRDPGGELVTYISRGIGAAPVWRLRRLRPRLLCRPEIALLTLNRSGDGRGDG